MANCEMALENHPSDKTTGAKGVIKPPEEHEKGRENKGERGRVKRHINSPNRIKLWKALWGA